MKNLLLSEKPIDQYTPEEYHAYVKGLHEEPKGKVEISARLNAQGTFILHTTRKPKWITRAEIEAFALEHKRPINEVWLYAKEKKYLIVGSPQEGREVATDVKEIKEVFGDTSEDEE